MGRQEEKSSKHEEASHLGGTMHGSFGVGMGRDGAKTSRWELDYTGQCYAKASGFYSKGSGTTEGFLSGE